MQVPESFSIFDVETLSLEAEKLAQSLQSLQELNFKRAKQEVKVSLKVQEKNRSDKNLSYRIKN